MSSTNFYKMVSIGEIIRKRSTRRVYSIIDKKNDNLLVINLMVNINPTPIELITPRDQDDFDRDLEILDLERWEADCLAKRLPNLVRFEEEEKKDDRPELII